MPFAVAPNEVRQEACLGPAGVIEVAGDRVLLELRDGRAWALVALAYPYQTMPGDLVLAISQGEACYVIGVLQGTGRTTITVTADLEISTPRGSIQLSSAKGIRLCSSAIKITSITLELVARTLSERFENARRWVKEAFQLRAGRLRTLVDSDYRVKAGRILERAQDDVKIDGRKIYLG